jgi:hypothetical protein
LAVLLFCEVNLKKAAAKFRGAEEKEPEPEAVGDWEVTAFLGWRRSCSALARAFSWVRTKLATF